MNLRDLISRSYTTAAAKGFWDVPDANSPESKLTKICLMHSELGEMTEGVRKPGPDQHITEFTQEEVELADLFIRGADYAGKYNLRLVEAIQAKMDYNDSRPYKHGKKI